MEKASEDDLDCRDPSSCCVFHTVPRGTAEISIALCARQTLNYFGMDLGGVLLHCSVIALFSVI